MGVTATAPDYAPAVDQAANMTEEAMSRPTLRQLRLRKPWTITELAEKSGVALATISDIERGKKTPRIATIRRLSEALGVAPDAIDWPGNPLELDPEEDTP